jgi:hypothetical protein
MLTRPSLARSIPFWILFLGSLLSAALGVLLVVSNISGMASDIKSQSATAAITVYTGQSWVVLGAALVGAGLIGLIIALLLGVLVSFVPAEATTTVVPAEDATSVFDATPAAPAAAPVADATAIPVAPPAEVDAAPAPAVDEAVASEPDAQR